MYRESNVKGRFKDSEMRREYEMTSCDNRDHITPRTVYSEDC